MKIYCLYVYVLLKLFENIKNKFEGHSNLDQLLLNLPLLLIFCNVKIT